MTEKPETKPETSEDAVVKKWLWKMDYCKMQKIPPAQAWAWNKSEVEFAKALLMTHNT